MFGLPAGAPLWLIRGPMVAPDSLAEAFARALPPPLAGRFGDGAPLAAALERLAEAGRVAWPALEVEAEAFIAHLAGRLQAESALDTLNAADLYLAFACVLGDPAALSAFDAAYLAKVPPVLRGMLPPGMTDDDVLQSLRLKLFLREGEAPPRIATYSGRGALVHWLRAAALRVAQDFARSRRLEVATADEDLVNTPAVAQEADVALLKSRFAPQFKAAFQEALAGLSARDQNLLRLHYLDGVSPEEIGRLYSTHRTTVWRWLTQCRQELMEKTRALLATRVPAEDEEFASLMNAVHSQLDVSLSRLLRKG